MKKKTLEFYLTKGKSFGFVKETTSNDYMGWISLSKFNPNPRFDELFTEEEQKSFHIKNKKEKPYIIIICELKKIAYEGEEYTKESDYRINEEYFFIDLDEVEEFLVKEGYKLENIKSISQIPSD